MTIVLPSPSDWSTCGWCGSTASDFVSHVCTRSLLGSLRVREFADGGMKPSIPNDGRDQVGVAPGGTRPFGARGPWAGADASLRAPRRRSAPFRARLRSAGDRVLLL